MQSKLVIRLSNNIGNQMFMYAFAYAFSRKLNRKLLIDNESAYNVKFNLHRYDLDIFNIQADIAPKNLKFLGNYGYIKRKVLKYFDSFKESKNFYIEPKDENKKTMFNKNYMNNIFNSTFFVEGHFETEKYFKDCIVDIKNEFTFKNIKSFVNSQIYKNIKNSNSVSICVRQNRFSEKKRAITSEDNQKSTIFTTDQIKYIKKSIDIIKSQINNPKFFLWSNDQKNLQSYFSNYDFTIVSTDNVGSDLFLMTQAKHHIVIPSSYNWWGAWLSDNKKGLILRPSENNFTNFTLNNQDFWPDSWTTV